MVSGKEMLVTHPIQNKHSPSETTGFLAPCTEEVIEDSLRRHRGRKKDVRRSLSCDIVPRKSRPFMAPLMSIINMPSKPNKRRIQHEMEEERIVRDLNHIRGLSITHSDTDWINEEDECLVNQHLPKSHLLHTRHHPFSTTTTDNTPFTNVSYQTYYQCRQTTGFGKSFKKSTKVMINGTSSEDLKNSGKDYVDARLRRRASSLDFLPEAINNKSVSPQPPAHQNGSISKAGSPFARTTSMSQRSPFRKKINHQDMPENSISGVREIRPKGIKRSKSGLDALFDAIERQEVNEVRRLINIHEFSINELNNEQFTALDMALMLNETEIARVLLNCGATENPMFLEPSERTNHLENLIKTAEENVNNYKTTLLNSIGDTKENERLLREWEWKLYLLKIMQSGFINAESPTRAPDVVVAPLSSNSIVVNLNRSSPISGPSKEIRTKYKVEWSEDENFEELLGHQLITDKRQLSCTIRDLQKGTEIFVRVQSGNHKGFSPHGYPDPPSVIPSSWHECDNSVPRYYGVSDKLYHLVDDLLLLSKSDKSSDDGSEDETQQVGSPQIRSPKSKNPSRKLVKSMSKYTNFIFNSAPKLLKKIKGRGIYLAALLYNSDLTKVVVTMDENLPVVECDDNYAKSFSQEFYWFSKTSCTWEDIRHMLYFSTKSNSSQSVYIRRKLLQSALVLMNATGVNDLGPIHFRPFRDEHGSILLLAVNCIKKISSSRTMTMKWTPIQKLLKKTSSINESVMVPERLIPSVQDQVTNHQKSRTKLPRGLYLGYLKLRTSVDTLSIIVPNSHTNVLPNVRIQDVPNVTKEQWEWLKSLNEIESMIISSDGLSSSLSVFEKRLKFAIRKLFNALNVSPDSALSHRIYDQEIIELNSDVMFILIFPSEVCTPPNQTDSFSSATAYTALPVQAFEMNNMMTYQPKLMSSYCRLSSILELENLSIQQSLRETICHDETNTLKEKQSKLSTFQQNVDDLWKVSRWVFDALQACQDKNLNVGIPLMNLFKVSDWSEVTNNRLSLVSQQSDSSCERDQFDSMTINSQDRASSVSLKVYGTEEIGFPNPVFTTITITEETTARDIIEMSVSQLLSSCSDSEENDDSDNTNEETEKFRTIATEDDLTNFALVVVAGSRERVLRDDLILLKLQNPWEKGTLYLRLKKEALRATKWGLTTAV